jgi:hypothetical protein
MGGVGAIGSGALRAEMAGEVMLKPGPGGIEIQLISNEKREVKAK